MRSIKISIFILSILFSFPFTKGEAQEQKRSITFLDIIQMKTLGSLRNGDISPDGKWFVYTIKVPDWEQNKRFEDIYITALSSGKTKQMTFTKGKNENSPKWYKDSSFFVFLSNRSEDKNQIFFMRPDGGEAWQVTDDKFGVSSFELSSNGKYLAYLGGRLEERQIWILPVEGGKAEILTNHKIPISSFLWNPNGKKIYYVASGHLWGIDIETKEEKDLTGINEYVVSDFIISDDGTKIAFVNFSTKSEIYLFDLNTNTISRLTNNSLDEWAMSFSPDSKWLAFVCGGDVILGDPGGKIYIKSTEGGEPKKLMGNFDYDDNVGYFWSDDSRYIYFTSQVGVNYNLFRLSIDKDQIILIAQFEGRVNFRKNKDSGKMLIAYSDPENPTDYFYSEPENCDDIDKWIRLTEANPQVNGFLLCKYETISWKSKDGRTIEGLLIKPANYRKDRKYPLIVDIHGGPASANFNDFSSEIQIFPANQYVVFQPNYRGSSGYGKEFKREVVGYNYGLSIDDIMTGVDYLIEKEIAHPDSMGIMGWSAGGDLSNIALVSTNRFKAISTGASSIVPKKNITNATTPTLIECGENDKESISQCEKLYVALQKLGVPTEFIVYPNTEHIIGRVEYGIGNMRYMMIKMQSEFYWFEKWIRGKEGLIDWNEMIEPLQDREN
jgi:dipeptidyl aminopeptidase/acylaminoacyl peptidase